MLKLNCYNIPIMNTNLVEYPKTIPQIKRGLRYLKVSQNKVALILGKSSAMISMVLNRKAKSQPILDGLAEFIVKEFRKRNDGHAA